MIYSKTKKKILKKIIKHLPFLAILLGSVIFGYLGLQNSYFEQDEWHSFGNYNFLLSLRGFEFLGNLLVSDFPFHFAPLSLIFKMSLYRIFLLNAEPYFIVSIFLHFLVSVSVYLLSLVLTKKKLAAFVGALFFAINSSHYQAVTWIGTFEGVQMSVLFGSLSLVVFLLYLQKEKFIFLLLTSSLLLIGLLFKETALTFLLLLGLATFFSKKNKLKIITAIFMFLVLVVYAALRYAYLLFGVQSTPISGIQGKNDLALIFGYNFFTSSVKIFAQVFFPNELLVHLSNITTSPNIYKFLARGPWVVENGFRYDLMTIPLGLLVIAVIWWIGRKTENRRPIFWGLGIVILTILPLLILNRYLTYLDSRYLYPATLGLSLIVGLLLFRVISINNRMVSSLCLLVLSVVLLMHLFSLRETVNGLVRMGQMRKSIISYIVRAYPRLPSKTVFYTESSSPFYGFPESEKIMPFQSGFGQLLLIIYNPEEHFAPEFFKNDFLWNITDQKYKELNGRGFGYFRDFDLMSETLKKRKLPLNAVISFYYDATNNKMIDTTSVIRQKLKTN